MRSKKLLWPAWFFRAMSVLVKFIHTAAFLLSNGTLPKGPHVFLEPRRYRPLGF